MIQFRLALAGFIIIVLFSSQTNPVNPTKSTILFYNVENLFDTIDDPLTNDSEFTPLGTRFWDTYKYKQKLINLYKAISSCSGLNTPSIIGLCEIENKQVVADLIRKTPLQKSNYQIVHYDSPDKRGIDVALIYKKADFKVLASEPLFVNLGTRSNTRDILYVKGILHKVDTLHLFVNHWPSRIGGVKKSEIKRLKAATVLRTKVDSLMKMNQRQKIIIMGDFNDYPNNLSIKSVLKATKPDSVIVKNKLYNLSAKFTSKQGIGSHKYNGKWGVLDQIIVSGSLLIPNSSINTNAEAVHICQSLFLFAPDDVGKSTFKTFTARKYSGGYSDHLPVTLDLYFKNSK